MANGGLFNKTTIPSEIEVDRSIPKIVILAVIEIISSFVFGYFLKLFLLQGQLEFLLFCFLALLVFLAFFLLNIFFIKASAIINLVVFLGVITFLAPFYDNLSKNTIMGGFFSFLFLLLAVHSGRRDIDNMLKIKFWRVSSGVIAKVIFGLALFIVFAYLQIVKPAEKEFFISQGTFEKIAEFIPSVNLALPLETLIKDMATKQIENNTQFKPSPESVKKELINQSIKELEKTISDFAGIPLDSRNKASTIIYQIIVEKFNNLSPNIKLFFPTGLAIIIFLLLMGLSPFINLIVVALAFLIYEICLATGFSVIIIENRGKEVVILK